MNGRAVATLAAGAVVFVLIARRAGPSALARAIARAEGFGVPGAIPTRANNPGDLKVGGTTIPPGGGGITVFATVADGWAALERQIDLITSGGSAHYSALTTIRQMGQKWTATAAEQLAWSNTVARSLGVPLDTPIGRVA